MASISRFLSAIGLACAAALYPASAAVAEPSDPFDPGTWPIADGNFTSPGDPGWIFFKPKGFGGHGCGIGPDGTVGCDIVPSRWPDGTPVQAGRPGPPGFYSCGSGENYCPLPPPGADQIVASPQQRADYAQSDTPAFTRDVGVLYEGYRLVNGNASCRLGAGSPLVLACDSGEHGFSVQAVGVRFW